MELLRFVSLDYKGPSDRLESLFVEHQLRCYRLHFLHYYATKPGTSISLEMLLEIKLCNSLSQLHP